MRTRIGMCALAAGLALGAVACGGGGGASKSAKPAAKSSGKGIKVALVTDSNQLNDRGFNHLAYVGVLRAERELGAKGRVFESRARAEYIPNLSSAARQGYDLVIGVGFDQADAVDTV